MSRRSLARILGVQWMLFAAVLVCGLSSVGLVALYVLEDSFIDARLLAAERALAGQGMVDPGVTLRRPGELPSEARAQVEGLKPGALREFRLVDDRYLHVRILAPDAVGPRLLVMEAQDELRVNAGLRRAAPLLLGLLVIVLATAAGLAWRFVARIERAGAGLLDALSDTAAPARLRTAAAQQPVAEFERLGQALADAWEARLAAVTREEETLRFLAHELRTPLQSARLSLATLAQDPANTRAWARLQRSVQRLGRASEAVLWLGERVPMTVEPVTVASVLTALTQELQPLAAQRGQTLRIDGGPGPRWPLPLAAAEVVLGNLVLNAIQHGGQGEIHMQVSDDTVSIANPLASNEAQAGFGLGLELSRRLLARIGWTLRQIDHGEAVRIALSPAHGPEKRPATA